MSKHSRFTDQDVLVQNTLSTETKSYKNSPTEDIISLGDHTIETSNEFCEFECLACDEKFEVPDIFQKSGGFKLIVYQLYILGHFENEQCPGYQNQTLSLKEAHEKYGYPDGNTRMNRGDRVYTTNDGKDITYYDRGPTGKTYWEVTSCPGLLMTEDVFKHLSDADSENFYEVLKRYTDVTPPRQLHIGKPMTTTTTSSGTTPRTLDSIPKDPLDSSDSGKDDSIDRDISAKEKFASEMLDRIERGDRKI